MVGGIATVLVAQAVTLVGVLVWLVVEFVVEPPPSVSTAGFLVLLVALAIVGWGAVIRGLLGRSGRSRGAIVFTQLLTIAIAAGSIQGDDAQWGIGLALGIPAVIVGLTALFSRTVGRYLGLDDDTP